MTDKTQFTKEELKEIEKIFDIQAGILTNSYAYLFTALGAFVDDDKEITIKLLTEYSNAFNRYREISAKASAMQEEVGK